ncbi:MAG: WG repeat-containing protein [Bacteroidota bacterium]
MKKMIAALLCLLPLFITAQDVFPIKQQQKWGLMTALGKLQIPPKYDALSTFDRYGYASIQIGEQVGLINRKGNVILPTKYDDVEVLEKKYFAVLQSGNWSLVNRQGRVLLDDYEDVIIWEKRGLIAFVQDGLWGMISTNGNIVLAANYEAIRPQGNFIIVQQNNDFGLHQLNGQQILRPIATELQAFDDHIYIYRKDGLWGAVDDTGKQLFAPEYEAYEVIGMNAIQLKQGANTLLYTTDRRQLIKGYFYQQFLPFSDDLFLVQQKQKFGLIDREGRLRLPAAFEEIQPYGTALFRVREGQLWGIVDQQANETLANFYDYIAPLQGGIALVIKNGQYGVLDRNAQISVPIQYDKIVVENGSIKAYIQGALDVYQLDQDGRIAQSQERSGEHITFKIGGKKEEATISTAPLLYQLKQFEWYFDANSNKWGLRNSKDGRSKIVPQYDYLKVYPTLNFTLVGIKKRNNLTFAQTNFGAEMVFGLVRNDLGAQVTPLQFLHIDLSDFVDAAVASCVIENGKHALIARSGKIILQDATYIGTFKKGIAPIAKYGQLSGAIRDEDKGLMMLQNYLNDLLSPTFMIDYTSDSQTFRRDAKLICSDCSWGYIDTLGKTIIVPQYAQIKAYKAGHALVNDGEKWGVVNRKGKAVVPFRYDAIDFLKGSEQPLLKVHIQSFQYGLLDTLGNIAIGARFEEIGMLSENMVAVQKGGQWGFVDEDGQQVIPNRYQQVQSFSDGMAAARQNGKWGFIDRNGKVVVPFQFGRVGNVKNGLFWATTGSGISYFDTEGQLAIAGPFDQAYDFEGKVARVVEDRKFGLIDEIGNYIVRPKFIDINNFDENNLAIVRYGSDRVRYGILNMSGDIITSNSYNDIRPYSEGRAAVKVKDKYGYIDTNGKLVIPTNYARVSTFVEGRAAVQENGECGYVDRNGNVIVDLAYSKCLAFNSGRAVVYKGYRRAGLLDDAGDAIIQPSLNRLINFQNGRGLMRDNQYRFYFITEDTRLFDGYYQEASNFQHGVAVVRSGDKWGIINRNGIKVVPPKYDKIENYESGFARIRIRGLHGVRTLKGQEVVPMQFEHIEAVAPNLYRAEQGNKIGYFDGQGKWIWKLQE